MFNNFFSQKEHLALKGLLTRPESLSSHFPYEEVLDEERVFANRDGSLGVVFEISLVEHEVLTEQEVVEKVNSTAAWFSLPENATLQVIFEQSPVSSLDSRFEAWEKAFGDGHQVSKLLFQKRLEMLRSNSVPGISVLESRAFVAIRWFPIQRSGVDFFSFYKDPNKTLLDTASHLTRNVSEFLNVVRGFETSSQIPLRRLSGAELVEYLRKFFNPVTFYKRKFAPFNKLLSISEQLIYSSPLLSFDGIEREGLKSRTISLKTSPSYAYPGGMAYFTTLPFPIRICLNFSFPSKMKVKKFFDVKEFFLENTPSARARRQKEEILEVQDRLARDDRCLHLSFHITVEGTSDEELDDRVRQILNIFHYKLETEAIVERDIGAGLSLNSLPLFYEQSTDLSTRRFIRILRSDAQKFLPIFGTFTGLSLPLQVYTSREGSPVLFSLLENETSNHTVVLADSGSGKSSLVIDTVQSIKKLSPEPLVFVIDKKSSYLMLSEYFDADLTVFGSSGEIPFSPFRGTFDDEKVRFLTQLLASGIKLTSPSFPIESDQLMVLGLSLRFAYERKLKDAELRLEGKTIVHDVVTNPPTLLMDDVIAEMALLPSLEGMEKLQAVVDDVIQKLSPFYGEGMYARYFNTPGPKDRERSKLFYIYDLDALDGDPTLQSLMTMSVVEEIRQTIKVHQDEGRTGVVILEELQMLGRGSSVGKQFVLDAAETFRKLGVWLVSLTPRPQNYFETEVGQAMWGVADNFLFLQMSSDNVDYLTKRSSMFDEASTEIIKSLRTVRGSHADFFFMNKKKTKQGVYRFFQTPFDRWLAPTNSKAAIEARKALKRHPNDKWKALAELVERD